jgi:hypothetical protein
MLQKMQDSSAGIAGDECKECGTIEILNRMIAEFVGLKRQSMHRHAQP